MHGPSLKEALEKMVLMHKLDQVKNGGGTLVKEIRVALRKCDSLDRGRARMTNQTVMDQYFNLLKETLNRLCIKNCPNRVYNCDESRAALEPKKRESESSYWKQAHLLSANGNKRSHHSSLLCKYCR